MSHAEDGQCADVMYLLLSRWTYQLQGTVHYRNTTLPICLCPSTHPSVISMHIPVCLSFSLCVHSCLHAFLCLCPSVTLSLPIHQQQIIVYPNYSIDKPDQAVKIEYEKSSMSIYWNSAFDQSSASLQCLSITKHMPSAFPALQQDNCRWPELVQSTPCKHHSSDPSGERV